jgi:hypothetical protein
MVAKARPRSESDLFLKLWERETLTVPVAKRILKLAFSAEEIERVSELRAKNSAGTISAEELAEFDAFVRVSMTVGILQSRARQFLKAAKLKVGRA